MQLLLNPLAHLLLPLPVILSRTQPGVRIERRIRDARVWRRRRRASIVTYARETARGFRGLRFGGGVVGVGGCGGGGGGGARGVIVEAAAASGVFAITTSPRCCRCRRRRVVVTAARSCFSGNVVVAGLRFRLAVKGSTGGGAA